MSNAYEIQLRQRILLLKSGLGSIIEFYNNEIGAQGTQQTNLYMHLSALSDYIKLQTLLKVYNENFESQEAKELEKIVNENIPLQENTLLAAINELIESKSKQ